MENTLRTINGVYYSIMMLAVLSAVIVFTLTFMNISTLNIAENSPVGRTFSSLLIIYILISIPLSMWLFYKNTKKWQQLPDKFTKFNAYKKASIIRLWIVGVGLIASVVLVYFMRSNNMMYCALISIIGLYFCKPTANKMIKELDLDEEDI
ncbi:conserved membrane hypothetical protein [uncultured Paludibacter sp.]|uniref:Uncharacterized protein n=1 Tax=uncultured Paludibacter sp. TaxID=497635 RepID=A0A653ACG8_9BACT|nr:conserved membrane hypothetical protein [uncultured Paludibacter sp.]